MTDTPKSVSLPDDCLWLSKHTTSPLEPHTTLKEVLPNDAASLQGQPAPALAMTVPAFACATHQ